MTEQQLTFSERQKLDKVFFILGTLFCICLIVSNILAFKIIPIGIFSATAGMIIIPISYIISDTITEIWGFKKTRFVIWCGFAMNFLTVLFFQLAIWLPSVPFWEHQTAFETVLGSTPRITVASMCGFLVGSFLNASIMSKMKTAQKGKNFSLRAIVSTIFGELGDSFVFFILAFSLILPFQNVIFMALFQTVAKIIIEILVLPITRIIVKRLKQYETAQ